VIDGRVTRILPDGRAEVEADNGLIKCRCAHGIDLGWLRSAVAVGPVDAEISIGARGGSLWAVFAGPEHRDVVPERVDLAASSGIRLSCGQSTVTLEHDGRVRVRGRDVTTRGSRVARVLGGTVRIN
jgi:hypothetical protein